MLRPSDVESEVIESEETTRRKLDEDIRIEAQPTTVETIAEEVQVAGEKVLRPNEETTKEFETEMFRAGKIDKVSVETKVTTIDVTSHKTQEAEEKVSGVSEFFPEVLEMEKAAAWKVKEETPVEVSLEAVDHGQEKIQEVEVKMEEADEFIDLLPESNRSVDTSTVVSGVSVKFPDGFHVQKPEDISQGYDEVESAADATSLMITPLTPEAEETGLETSTAVSEREPSTEELATATEVGVKEQTDAWEAQEPAENAIYKQETQYDGEEEIPEEFVEDVGIAAPSELSAGEVMQTESESKVEAETTAETEVPTMEYTRKEIQEAAEKVLGLRPGEVISEETAAKVESKFDDVSVFEMEAEDRMLRPSEVVSEGIESTKRAEEEVRIEAEEVSVESVSEKVQETEEKLLKPTEEITKEFEIDISAAGKTDAVTVETHVTSMESTSNKMQESEGKVLRVHDVVTEVIESEESEAHKGWEEVTIGGRLKDAEEPSQEQIHGAGVGNLQLEEADEMTDFLPESVRKERIEGELKEIEDTKEKETVKEDGTRVKTTTKTIAHVQIVTEVTWKGDVNTGETEREELVGKDINEEILEIAPGIDDLGAENVRIETSVTDSEKTLADGTWEKRKTTRKTIRPSVFGVEPSVEEKKQQKMKIYEQSQIEGEGAMEVVSEQLEEAGEVLFEPREDITRKTDVFSEERTSWEVNENLVESMVQSESGWIDIRQPKSVIESDYRDKLAPDFTESNSFETVDFSEHSVQKVAEPTASNTERTEQEDLGFEEFSEEYSVTKSTKFVAHETVDGSISDSKNKIARVKDVGAEADTSVDAEEKGFEDYSEEYWETRKTIVANDEVATAKKTGQERTSEDTGMASNTEVVYEVDNMEKSVAGLSGHEEENLDTSVTNEWCVVDRETFDTEEHTMHSYEVITTVKQKKMRTVMIRSIGPDGEISENLETEEYESSNESESLSRRSSIDSTTETLATGEMAVQKYDPELRNITVFTDTIEEDPVVDTEMMEYEDTLPDGTIVKRKVTKTKTKQSVVRRVVLEGLDDEPSFVDPSSQALVQVRPGVQQFTRYSDHHSTEPDVTTDIQVTEDKLPDGTVVRKRITNTKQQQLITERLVLGGTGLFDEEGGEDEVFESLKKMGSSPRNSLELQALKERLSSSGTSVPGDRTPSSAASGQKEMDEWEIVDKQ